MSVGSSGLISMTAASMYNTGACQRNQVVPSVNNDHGSCVTPCLQGTMEAFVWRQHTLRKINNALFDVGIACYVHSVCDIHTILLV